MTRARPYLLALGWSLLFVLLRLGMEPVLEGRAPLLVLLAAPILASWSGGFRAGMAATVLCLLMAELLFFRPSIAVTLNKPPSEWLRLGVFVLYGGLFSWLVHSRKSTLQRVRQTLEAAPSAMLVVTPEGRIELVNSQAERHFGYTRSELVGMRIDDLVPDGVRPQHATFRAQFHAQPSSRPMGHGRDLMARRKDGSVFPVEIGLNPLQGDDAGRVLASVVDISGRKAAEQALRASEQRAHELATRAEAERALLDATLDAAPTGIILADAQGRLIRFNPANAQIWGEPPDSARSADHSLWKGWWADNSARHGQAVRTHEWALARALGGEEVRDDVVEIEPFDAPGTRRTTVNSAAPVRDAQGRITGAVVVQTDVSALAAARDALSENEALFRSLADNIPQLAWMAEAAGDIYWYNRRWYEFTGTTLQEMRGWGWQHVHHPEHLPRVVDKFRQHLASGEPWEDTFPLRSKDGEYRWFLSRAFPLRDRTGRITSWFGTNTDITAQRQAEEALRESDRRKDEFIAVLAHELRNPLAPVRNAVEILKRLGPPEPALQRSRDIIDRQVAHMARLIDDLLDVSRIARGKLSLQRERCDLAAIVRQTAEDYRPTLEAVGQQLQLQLPAQPLWVQGDPVRLAQMLSNLLTNAARFHTQPGQVQVRAEADAASGQACIRVADTGIGIEPELLARLFDPFAQAAQDLARTRGGLGLGLTLTKGLADLHGGSICAESAGLGQGACFTITLPLLAASDGAVGSGSAPQAEQPALRILLVEDNPDAAATLGELLGMMGHEVRTAPDGESGVDQARQWRPDVVISDIGLPGAVDGYALARQLRQDDALAGLVLIALSGYADQSAQRRCAEAGYDRHFAKPPDLAALEQALARIRPGTAAEAVAA